MKAKKSYYGNTVLLKMTCPMCELESIIVENKFTCCGIKAEIDKIDSIKKKRESITATVRTRPPRKAQRRILRHQNYQCLYCGVSLRGRRSIEYDHFIPFCASAKNEDNWIAACKICNRIKSVKVFDSAYEARLFIISELERKGIPYYNYWGGNYDVRKL